MCTAYASLPLFSHVQCSHVSYGSGAETFERETLKLAANPGRAKVSPFTIPALLGNTASGIVGIECDARGPNYGVVSACASGSHSIGEAAQMIRAGEATQMLAGGCEATITPLVFAGFCAMKAMCTAYNDEPKKASRPFDDKRAGFVMGEGAGVVLLESLESAKARGAKVSLLPRCSNTDTHSPLSLIAAHYSDRKPPPHYFVRYSFSTCSHRVRGQIYCELAGYGASCDAHHITTPAPGGRGLVDAMERSLKNSGVSKEEVKYVNAHGTSTAYNDRFETMAIR